MENIKWSEIEAECGDYRAGFVGTFKKYEGQSTDEKDGAGRIVVVTIASFARHAGIPRKTFEGWVLRDGGAARRDRGHGRDESGARKVLADPKATEEVVKNLPTEHVDRLADQARIESDKRFVDEKVKPKKAKPWTTLMGRLSSAQHNAERALTEIRGAGDQLPEATAEGLAEKAEKTAAAYEMLAAYLRGDSLTDEVEAFLAGVDQ